ncbi:aminoglycoside phosphotransferase family protein [Oceanithermus desulfurans]|uniref:Aminoglycoside phosphotransferase n=2 Tax=Oceanithermus desulfurans TaxID=227924 RepID=A0A511RIP8_9DEIN|nr:aminoglycoside phosphotransferase family protein [Oceanithermus desulfurans]MBB6030602.1 thiamine kinase [Oceanithermus desulfurans]GEM89520.1 aminoglycoside phosphotransferase [Oceanithermus desulfurans NBRC 100063]
MATLNVPGNVVKRLEAALGTPLHPAAEGQEARVFFTDGRVIKIYGPHERHLPRLEARNLARAGLGAWVEAVWGDHRLEGYAALVLRRFPGRPFEPGRFGPRALAQLAGFLLRLHRLPEPGLTRLEPIQARWRRFRKALADLPAAVEALEALKPRLPRLAGVPRVFAHNDLWAGNVLVAPDGAVLVVDWSRAGGEDPARDLAILTTGSLGLLPHERCLETLRKIVRCYPDPGGVWGRLRIWIPLTLLHDLHWFREKEPAGFEAALADKLPRIERALHAFPATPW